MGKKPKSNVVGPAETLKLMQQQQVMNNPNMANPYGSSQTTFGPDGQATITQQFTPDMQNIFDQRVAFAQQGPQQYQREDLSMLEGMYNNFSSRLGAGQGFDTNRELGQYLQQGPLPQSQDMPQPQYDSPSPMFSPNQDYSDRFINGMPPYRRR